MRLKYWMFIFWMNVTMGLLFAIKGDPHVFVALAMIALSGCIVEGLRNKP